MTTRGDRRIFTSAGTWLYALDARTGLPVRTFGENGSIHLGQGMGIEETPPNTLLNTPGVIYKDLLIMGGLVSEATAGGHPGVRRAHGPAAVGLPHDSASR